MHFADVHLGVETHGRPNPQTGLNTRLEDFRDALNASVDRALGADVDLAIFAGDAYKARDPSQTHQQLFAQCLKRLTDSGVPVAMLIGNHDIPAGRGRAHALEIYGLLGGAGVRLFARAEVAPMQTRKGTVLVAGMPYLTRARVLAQDEARGKSIEEVAQLIRDKYVGYIAQLAEECAAQPEVIALLMGHFTVADARVGVQGMLTSPAEPQVPVSALTLPAFDYVALGHIHKPQELNGGAQPPVVYCGSIDRIDFGERRDDKGFVLADIRKGFAEWKHVAAPTRPFVEIDAVVPDDSLDPTDEVLRSIARHTIDGAVVKLTYRISAARVALVREDELRRALAPAHLVAALTRDLGQTETAVRSKGLTESLAPEQALALYLDGQTKLPLPQDDLLDAARALIEELAQEENAA
jgi:exonuclease SbcD